MRETCFLMSGVYFEDHRSPRALHLQEMGIVGPGGSRRGAYYFSGLLWRDLNHPMNPWRGDIQESMGSAELSNIHFQEVEAEQDASGRTFTPVKLFFDKRYDDAHPHVIHYTFERAPGSLVWEGKYETDTPLIPSNATRCTLTPVDPETFFVAMPTR